MRVQATSLSREGVVQYGAGACYQKEREGELSERKTDGQQLAIGDTAAHEMSSSRTDS
jgi:hypothetical protein